MASQPASAGARARRRAPAAKRRPRGGARGRGAQKSGAKSGKGATKGGAEGAGEGTPAAAAQAEPAPNDPAGTAQQNEGSLAQGAHATDDEQARDTAGEPSVEVAPESIPPAEYDAMAYYDRWIVALAQSLIQRGLITTGELAKKMAQHGS